MSADQRAYAADPASSMAARTPRVQTIAIGSDGLSFGLELSHDPGRLHWAVTLAQLRSWGGWLGDDIAWELQEPHRAVFLINGRRVAEGRRTANGEYSWIVVEVRAADWHRERA